VNVLFVCVHNAGRSQMAEALFRRASAGRHDSRSAGTSPAGQVHPEVVSAMKELGIDLSGRVPRRLETADADWADLVVTMGCGDACPVIPGKRYFDWELDDPAGLPLERVREIRDEIARRVEALRAELDGERSP
jgi:arsenate reductase